MANTKRYIVEVDANTGKMTKKIEASKKEVKGLDKEVKNTGNSFGGVTSKVDGMTGGLLSMASKGLQGLRGLTMGFKTLRGAIISTGIGAIVVAVVSLIQAVSRLQRVQDKYKQASAALGAVFDILLDKVAYIGEFLIDVFTNPQKAIEDLWELIKTNLMNRLEGLIGTFQAAGKVLQGVFELDWDKIKEGAVDYGNAVLQTMSGIEDPINKIVEGTKNLADETARAARNAAALEAAEQKLQDLQISQIETQARRRREIAAARLMAEDETKSLQERQEALEEAIALEQLNLQEQLQNAKEEARIIAERNALAESSREDVRREAEARARVFQLEEQSLRQQKRLATELESLRREAQAAADKAQAEEDKKAEELKKQQEKEAEERLKAEQEIQSKINDVTLSAFDKEILAAEQKYNKLLELARQHGINTMELEAAMSQELSAIREKERQRIQAEQDAADQKELEQERAVQEAKVNLALQAGKALTGLLDAFGGESEQAARRAFNINKALGIADAVVNTSRAITKALAETTDPTPTQSLRFGNAAIAAATGAAQIASIAATKFQGGGGGGGSAPRLASGGGQIAAGAPQLPQPEFQNNTQQNIRAFVVEKNVTDAQAQNQKINEQASLTL